MEKDSLPGKMKLSPNQQKALSILIFIGSLALSFSIFLIPVNTTELGLLGYGGMFLITLLGAMTLFVPGPTMVAAFVIGATLNPFLVSLVAGLGSAIGESTGYSAGYATRALVEEREGKNRWYERIFGWMRSHPFFTIFILAAIPNFLTDVSGLIAGRIRYPYLKFLLATFLGKTIRFGMSAFLGADLGRFFLR